APTAIRAITAPSAAEPPSATTSSASTPSCSASYTIVALSVSTSTSGSPLATGSPGAFSHATIVPSSIESESRGIMTSTTVLEPGCIPVEVDRAARVVAAEHDPDRVYDVAAVVVQPVRGARFEGDRVAGLENVLLEADGDAEAPVDHGPELAPVVAHQCAVR